MENDGTIKSNPRPCNGHAVKDFFEGLFDLMDSNPIPGSNVAQNEDNDYPDEPDPDTHNPDKYL